MPKILIVEDETDAAMLLGKRLSKNGFDILTANDVLDSIAILKKEKVDLVILDLMLPLLLLLLLLLQCSDWEACRKAILGLFVRCQKTMASGVICAFDSCSKGKQLQVQ